MYYGLIVLGVLAALLFLGLGKTGLRQLRLSSTFALLLIFAILATGFVSPQLVGRVRLGLSGILLALVSIIWWLTDKNRRSKWLAVPAMLGVGGILAAIYLLAGHFLDLKYGDLLIPFVAGTSAYLLARSIRAGIFISIFSIFFGDMLRFFIPAFDSDLLLIGAKPQYDYILLAVFVFLILYCTIGFFTEKFKTNKKPLNQAEIAQMWDEEQADA